MAGGRRPAPVQDSAHGTGQGTLGALSELLSSWLTSAFNFAINKSALAQSADGFLARCPPGLNSGIRRGLLGRSRPAPTTIASLHGEDIGFLTLVHHSPYAAEVYVMGVLPDHHRRGVGGKMLKHVEGSLTRAGVEFLQVKTLSAKHPDEGYEKTRAFYLAYGFRRLEEFPSLWSPENPALQLIKAVAKQ